ncbi:MAG: response regulator [Bacteroidota bacterium]
MNILILEDELLLLKTLSYKLAQRGYRVFPADNGKKAVDTVVEHPIDVIICDLMLPVIPGITFLYRRHKLMQTQAPVIVISALRNAEEILRELSVDYTYFLKKPLNLEKLYVLLGQLKKINDHSQARALTRSGQAKDAKPKSS